MKIQSEQLNKLKQLDRIEYLSKLNYNERKDSSPLIFIIAFLFLICMYLSLISQSITNESNYTILAVAFIGLVILSLIAQSIMFDRYKKGKEDIQNEYFKIDKKW